MTHAGLSQFHLPIQPDGRAQCGRPAGNRGILHEGSNPRAVYRDRGFSYITVKWSGFRTEVKCREWGLAHHVSNRGAHSATPQHNAHANSKIRNSRTTAGIAVSSCNSNNNSNRARSKSPFLWLSTHCSSSC